MRPKSTGDTGSTTPSKRGPGRPPLKRRRTSSVASSSKNEDDDADLPQEPSRKRKKMDPTEVLNQLYEIIRNHKKDDGSLLCDAFIRVPKRRQEPSYYEVVSNPIDLLKIQQKLKTDEYEEVEDLQVDVELLVNNAKAFYKRNSQEYKDASEFWELFLTTKQKILEEPKSTSSEETPDNKTKIILRVSKPKRSVEREKDRSGEESDNWTQDDELNSCEDLFTAVMTAADDTNRPLHLVFQLLPSKKRYPKYYEVIDNPIDLRAIARKIQDAKYTSLNEMEKDLFLMTRNACTFNEPGSQIYKDAKALRKIVQSKKIEIETSKQPGSASGKSSERIRNKRMRGGQSLSAITAALKDDEEESDDDMVDVASDDADNPKWQLYLAVKTASNAQGQELSEPFWRLPSKRYYPDYYKEIKNPLCLMQIGKKLKRGDYGTVSEVAGDMNIMFENAKKYNRADSRLYKDAVKLQKLMQTKVQEVLELDHQYSDSEDDSGDEPVSVPKTQVTSKGSTRCLTRGKYLNNIPLKRRLYSLCKILIDYCEDGRQPMLMFMEKPSKKLYPDYYKVIDHPIDMLTIEANIKAEKYQSEEEVLNDFKLMFSNCKKYNEEGSMIHEDAIKLQKVLMDRVKELGPLPDVTTRKSAPRTLTPKPRKLNPNPGSFTKDYAKMKTFFNTIKDYKDPKNNKQLSVIFNKLPSKIEYPDYYEVIKKPINMEQIAQKLKVGIYENLDDLYSEFTLMFDNACKYNEPDSQIYKDALVLQRVSLQTKLQLKANEDAVPDVTAAVQELLTSLFTSVYNHQDEEGRCFSDSMQELPEHDEVDGKKLRALSLDLIKRRLDTNQYRRLDQFQEDLFSCMDRARRLSRTDSQVFEDSVELQSYFIRQRDELCLNGDLLNSPALNFMLLDLSAAVDNMRQQKLLQELPEQQEEEEQTRSSEDNTSRDGSSHSGGLAVGVADNALSYNQQVYRIGDFVYAEPKERGMESILLHIQRLWTNTEGQQMLYANQYYRPRETYHVTTRRFLEKEVFKTDQHVAIPLNQVIGRCCVLSVKDYFRSKPENFDEKDVYVCESRYSSKARAFKKIKSWPLQNSGYKLVSRDELLEPKRVMSVFRERVEKHKEEIAELEEREKLVEKEKPNVVLQSDDAITYYEQYNVNGLVLKSGDCVYVKTDTDAKAISQIDSIWTNAEGEAFFHGPWLVLPTAIPQAQSRTFYKQEVFLSTLEDTNPVCNIVGKCAVLEHSEYISCRPTEIPEKDVYICESQYDEARRAIKELPRDGLKKYTHSATVTQDEIYFFRRLINPQKVGANPAEQESKSNLYLQNYDQNSCSVSSPGTTFKLEDMMCEDSMDGGPPSVGSFHLGDNSNMSTPLTSKKRRDQRRLVTGYILYSGDVRKGIAAENPAKTFGEVSRLVGNEVVCPANPPIRSLLLQHLFLKNGVFRSPVKPRILWRNLPTSEKVAWEEKAARVNEETTAKMAAEEMSGVASPVVAPGQQHPDLVYECCWDNCDWQFEDMQDCIDHAVTEGCGHVHMFFAAIPPHELEFQCQWRGCTRMRKAIAPFPSLQRLARHVKEVHIMKSQGRVVHPDHRSKRFLPSTRHKPVTKPLPLSNLPGISMHAASMAPGLVNYSRNTPSPASQNGGGSIGGRNQEPLFVTVPPRPQRLLHSEAYIKYIEGLHADSRHISNWDRQLKATQETVDPPDMTRLPAHWLGNGVGNHGNILNALWTLRDFMFRDALGISKLV